MKLNIGSGTPKGEYTNQEWINLEYCTKFRGNNLVFGNGCALPFKNNSFERIHCVHVLEHLERKDQPQLLKEIRRVLKPGAVAYVEVPNIIGIINIIKVLYNVYKKKPNEEQAERLRCFLLSIYGKGRYNGDIHRWGFYPEMLKSDMESVGFEAEITDERISAHYTKEPVIVVKGTK